MIAEYDMNWAQTNRHRSITCVRESVHVRSERQPKCRIARVINFGHRGMHIKREAEKTSALIPGREGGAKPFHFARGVDARREWHFGLDNSIVHTKTAMTQCRMIYIDNFRQPFHSRNTSLAFGGGNGLLCIHTRSHESLVEHV